MRGNDKGKDFDDQWEGSRRAGQYKASRGEGAWSADKYRERLDARLSGPPVHHAGESKGCGKSAVALLGFLAGLGWLLDETVRWIA